MGEINIRRETDAILANRLSNEPAIHAILARHGKPIDWEPAVRGAVILSNGEDAVMVFEMTGNERSWQVCTIYGETCRGKRALETGRAMRDWMIPRWADLIFGPIPNNLPAARWFYRQMGGKLTDRVTIDGQDYVSPNDDETLFVLEAA